jgi:hypothetical protein
MNISGAWGYGAVIFPHKLEYQGFVVIDPEDERIRERVETAIKMANEVREDLPIEAPLAASLVSCMVGGDEFGVAVFSSALSKSIGFKFWVVDAKTDPDGTFTQVSTLKEQTTAEAAREAIERRCLPLKMGQALKNLKTRTSATEVDPAEPADDDHH